MHKKVESYFTWVSERKNQGKHLEFLSARKDWIKQHNEGGPDCKRLQSKKALLDAKKTLQVTRKTGGRFLAPKREFIAKDSWDESKHGPLDPSKVVTEDIFGQKVEGCWRLKGKKGIYDFEEYQDAAIEEKETIHDSADAPFSEEALARKRKAVMDAFAEGSATRERNAVQGTELSMDELVQAIQDRHPTASAPGLSLAAVPALGDVEEQVDGESKSSNSSSSSEEEEESGCATLFGPQPKTKAQPKAAPVSKHPAPGKAGVPLMPPPSKAPAGKVKEKKAKIESAGSLNKKDTDSSLDSSATLVADGRAQRALKNLQESVAKWKDGLKQIRVNDEPPKPDAQSQAQFKIECSERCASAKTLARNAREYWKRMDKSANKELFDTEMQELQAVERAAVALQGLFGISSSVASVPAAVAKAYEEAEQYVYLLDADSLGTCFQLKYAFAKASENCLYREYEKYCRVFLKEGEMMKGLLASMGEKDLANFVIAEVEGRILLALRAIKLTDIDAMVNGQEEIASLQECQELCQAIVEVARVEGEEFLAASLADPCAIALGFVSATDISATNRSLAAIEKCKDEADEEDGKGALAIYFLQHATGQSLVDLALSRVESGENEANATERLKILEAKLSHTEASLSQDHAVRGVKIISETLQPIEKMIAECNKEIASLKSSRDQKGKEGEDKAKGKKENQKADAASAKHRLRAYDRLMNGLAECKTKFAEIANTILLVELKANLSQNLSLGQ